jgi:putative transposase
VKGTRSPDYRQGGWPGGRRCQRPKCPELNPVENVWQFLRDNWLSNRVFKSYDDLVDHCCVAWNKLVNQPWRIMSLGLRQWAHRF